MGSDVIINTGPPPSTALVASGGRLFDFCTLSDRDHWAHWAKGDALAVGGAGQEADGDRTTATRRFSLVWVSSSAVGMSQYLSGSFLHNRWSGARAVESEFDIVIRLGEDLAAAIEHKIRTRSLGNSLLQWLGAWARTESGTLFLSDTERAIDDRALLSAKDISTRLSTAEEIGLEEAIEVAYEELYKQLEKGAEGLCAIDAFLGSMNAKRYSNSVLLAILTVTAFSTVSPQLRHRAVFSSKVAQVLRDREGAEAAAELLMGLE